MRKLREVLRKVGLNSLKRAAGFTLYEQMIVVFVGSAALLGGWAAFRDFSMQWRVANAERQMDQYAQTAMTEIVNVLQWSLGAYQLSGGRNPTWRIAIGEQVGENNGLNSTNREGGHFPYQTDNYFTMTQFLYNHKTSGGFITLGHQADRGILFNGGQPDWANNRVDQWVWRGRQARDPQRMLAAFDQRDRMRVIEFSVDYPLVTDPRANYESNYGREFKSSAIKVKIVMQYRYRASEGIGLYGDDYIRERVYETTVSPLNHGSAISDNRFYIDFVRGGGIGL